MDKDRRYYSTRALLREYRRIYEHKPARLKKSLGQHLLANSGMLKEIARICEPKPEALLIEIGAGIGNLTQALLRYNPRKYIGIELDEHFKPLHQRFFADLPGVEFIYDDVLKVDFARLVNDFEDVIIVGNIPFQITSPLIMKLLTGDFYWSRIVLTMQKEVAERLVASPGTKKVSALTYKVNLFAIPKIAFFISARNFIPPPKVDSAVMKFLHRSEPLLPREKVKTFFRLIDAAFSQRRKTILNALASSQITNFPKERLKEILRQADINPGDRAEQLSIDDFLRLFSLLKPCQP